MNVDCFTINAKCFGLEELFGHMNPITLKWSDGLLGSAVRTYAEELSQVEKKRTRTSSNVSL